MTERLFCSLLSREDNESLYGTASRGQIWMLLEYPQPWGSNPLRDSNLAIEIKDFLYRALQSIPKSRLLMIQQPKSRRENIFFYIAIATERNPSLYKFVLDSYKDLLAIELPRGLNALSQSDLVDVGELLFVVCTDGKHDKCCSKYGYPIYRSLSSYAAGATWQSSHVGGDRFAANVVCFPHGIFYGHLAESDLGPIVDDYQKRRVRLQNFRGRSCYSFVVQAAEFFARSEIGNTSLDNLFLIQALRVEEDIWNIEFALDGDAVCWVKLATFKSEFHNYLTCNAPNEESVPQFKLLEYGVS